MSGVTVEGIDKLRIAVAKYNAEVQRRILGAMRRGALAIQRDAILEIAHGTKTGHEYLRFSAKTGRQVKSHIASAPGEAPATDTGQLVSGIRVQVDDDGKTVRVVSKAPYSMALEFGTVNMAARPFLGPSYLKNLPGIKLDYKAAVKWKPGK